MSTIVFEGLPSAGKTSLIIRISKKMGALMIPETINSRCNYKNIENKFVLNDLNKSEKIFELEKNKSLVLVDRYYYSTVIMRVFLKKLPWTTKSLEYQKFNLYPRNALIEPLGIVYLKIPVEYVIKRISARATRGDKWPYNKSLLNCFANLYQIWFASSDLKVLEVNALNDIYQIEKEVVEWIKRL